MSCILAVSMIVYERGAKSIYTVPINDISCILNWNENVTKSVTPSPHPHPSPSTNRCQIPHRSRQARLYVELPMFWEQKYAQSQNVELFSFSERAHSRNSAQDSGVCGSHGKEPNIYIYIYIYIYISFLSFCLHRFIYSVNSVFYHHHVSFKHVTWYISKCLDMSMCVCEWAC